MKIGIVFIATRRYTRFILPLHASFEKYFLKGHAKKYYLFTDAKGELFEHFEVIRIQHAPWPHLILKKFHYLYSLAGRFRLDKVDVVYFCDADSRVVAQVGKECLPTKDHPLIAVRMAYEVKEEPVQRSIERNPESTAYIDLNETFPHYLRSPLMGGLREPFLRAAKVITRNIDIDTQNKVIAKFHEESHWHRYYVSNPDLFKILSHEYMYNEMILRGHPNYAALVGRGEYKPKIVELAKNDSYYRNGIWAGIWLWMGWKANGLSHMLQTGNYIQIFRQIIRLGRHKQYRGKG